MKRVVRIVLGLVVDVLGGASSVLICVENYVVRIHNDLATAERRNAE